MKVPDIQVPDVDTFGSGKHQKIKVWRTPRFMACCEGMARIDLPTDAAWKLLTHEDNHKVFGSVSVRCVSYYHHAEHVSELQEPWHTFSVASTCAGHQLSLIHI